jgi:NADPH:quinone reductase-like Zn-dependent oxidoreductase
LKFKKIVVIRRGGLDALRVVEAELRPPAAGEVNVKILASPICPDDIAARVGNRPFLPRPPFTRAMSGWKAAR